MMKARRTVSQSADDPRCAHPYSMDSSSTGQVYIPTQPVEMGDLAACFCFGGAGRLPCFECSVFAYFSFAFRWRGVWAWGRDLVRGRASRSSLVGRRG
jgi:hypothetical protein